MQPPEKMNEMHSFTTQTIVIKQLNIYPQALFGVHGQEISMLDFHVGVGGSSLVSVIALLPSKTRKFAPH